MMSNNDLSWQPWVFYTESLTEKLRLLADDVRLEVLSHRIGSLDEWAQTALKISDPVGLVREIVTWAQHQRCWYARTVIPQATLQAGESLFARLGHEPLGQLIFSNPHIQRVDLSPRLLMGPAADTTLATLPEKMLQGLQCIHYPSAEWHWLPADCCLPQDRLWGRLSTFMLHQQYPFYLYEIFLPNLSDYL